MLTLSVLALKDTKSDREANFKIHKAYVMKRRVSPFAVKARCLCSLQRPATLSLWLSVSFIQTPCASHYPWGFHLRVSHKGHHYSPPLCSNNRSTLSLLFPDPSLPYKAWRHIGDINCHWVNFIPKFSVQTNSTASDSSGVSSEFQDSQTHSGCLVYLLQYITPANKICMPYYSQGPLELEFGTLR